MMTKIDLPDVTLVSIDTTDDLRGTLSGVFTSMSGINYGAVKLITTQEQIDKNPQFVDEGITAEVTVVPIKDYNDYNHYVIYDLYNHVDTYFLLIHLKN